MPVPTSFATGKLPDSREPAGWIPLDGTLERNSFPTLITAFVSLVIFLGLFNLVGAIIGFVAIAANGGMDALLASVEDPNGLQTLVGEHLSELLIGNTVGQFLCIGLAAWFMARLTSSRPLGYLRFRGSDIRLVGLSLIALIAFQPLVSLAGELWSALPWPEAWREFEAQLMEPVNAVLQKPDSLLPNLLMIAVTPALCEELLFRGYFQRNCERSVGTVWAIVIVGVVFGAYHLQPTKLLPLAMLGSFFAYLVWKGGSLWPAIIAHFANNALAVGVGTYFARKPDFDASDLENMSFAWYFVVLGLLVFAGCMVLFRRLADEETQADPAVPIVPIPEDVNANE